MVNMKIGLFFGSFAGGGAERMMVNLAKGLYQEGVDVTIYVVNKTGTYLIEVPDHIPIKSYNANFGVKSVIHKIRKTLKVDGLSAFISTQMHINSAVGLASIGLKNRPKLIFREANTPSKIIDSRIKGRVYKWCYSFADYYVAVSKGVKKDMVDYFKLDERKVSVIYNPVIDNTIYEKIDEDVLHPWFNHSEIPVLVGMGRFAPQKAFEDLVDAFVLVRKERKVRLVIFGRKEKSSSYYKMIQKKIEASGFSEDIWLPGFVDNPFKYLKKADVFVLSSKFEGLPGVLIQAMACGCPVISTDCPSGPREILEDGKYGKLVNVGDVESIGETIFNTLNNSHRNNSTNYVQKKFSVENSVSSFIKLIEKI